MIKLYGKYWQDRSDRVRWLLEEMNVPYENVFLKKEKGETDSPEYRKLNPLGRVPTIVDGDVVIHESAAICLYLADKYSKGKLAPNESDAKLRAEYIQWMVHSVGTLEAVVARMFENFEDAEAENRTNKFVKEQCEILKKLYNPILEKQDYFLPSGFSAVDIIMAAIIPGAHDYLVRNNPPMERYMKRLMERPAAIKAKVF